MDATDAVADVSTNLINDSGVEEAKNSSLMDTDEIIGAQPEIVIEEGLLIRCLYYIAYIALLILRS